MVRTARHPDRTWSIANMSENELAMVVCALECKVNQMTRDGLMGSEIGPYIEMIDTIKRDGPW